MTRQFVSCLIQKLGYEYQYKEAKTLINPSLKGRSKHER